MMNAGGMATLSDPGAGRGREGGKGTDRTIVSHNYVISKLPWMPSRRAKADQVTASGRGH
jgi:hypothetical protein